MTLAPGTRLGRYEIRSKLGARRSARKRHTHRDIKPSNIMITPRGQSKLLDFGLAKVRRSIQEENTSDATAQLKTAEGIVIGTVMYMSPEQTLIDSIAVLPLVNASGEANVEYLSDGITESISARSF